MEWIGLNVFQRVTRHWDIIHPYNAAQVMKLAGRPDRQALLEQWRSTLKELGLGYVRLIRNKYRWEKADDDDVKLIEVAPGATLAQLMSVELNHAFDDWTGVPFRAFVVEQDDGYYAGIVYHHWVADSFSIRLLLREWFLRLHDPAAARRKPLKIAEVGYWRLFGPDQGKWKFDDAFFGMFRWGSQFRRARRIDSKAFHDFSTHFGVFQGPDGLIQKVAANARCKGVTVNDVFLAAMAQVIDELALLHLMPWRKDLALGSIVDIRGQSPRRMDETFGLFLGFTSVICREKELPDWEQLLARIHWQSVRQKNLHSAESSMMRMYSGLVMAKLLSTRRLLEFYRKRLAMAGGISNVNLNADWPARYRPSPLLDYVRVSPIGPWMPLVFTPTTLGVGMNIGITCRSSVIPPGQVQPLAEAFIAKLQRFAQS